MTPAPPLVQSVPYGRYFHTRNGRTGNSSEHPKSRHGPKLQHSHQADAWPIGRLSTLRIAPQRGLASARITGLWVPGWPPSIGVPTAKRLHSTVHVPRDIRTPMASYNGRRNNVGIETGGCASSAGVFPFGLSRKPIQSARFLFGRQF